MSMHHPRIRIYSTRGVRHHHADVAGAVMRSLDTYVRLLGGPQVPGLYSEEAGAWLEFDEENWAQVQGKLLHGSHAIHPAPLLERTTVSVPRRAPCILEEEEVGRARTVFPARGDSRNSSLPWTNPLVWSPTNEVTNSGNGKHRTYQGFHRFQWLAGGADSTGISISGWVVLTGATGDA